MDIFEKPYELENQLILRLPQKQAERLKNIILAGNLKDRLSIHFPADGRQGQLTLDGETLNIKLYDLPCLIESLKTLDMKTFYKTSDIAQIMVCSTEDDNEVSEQPSTKATYLKEKKHLWPHGITPPLKNVRHRRFRKTARKKYGDSPDVQKEVMRLLKADLEAHHTKFEILTEDKDNKANESASSQAAESETNADELHKIFQDVSSSEDEDEESTRWLDFTTKDLPTDVEVVTDQTERKHLEEQVEKLTHELEELYKRKQRKGQLVIADSIQNRMLKERFQQEFEDLKQRFNETRQRYLTCLAMLGRNK